MNAINLSMNRSSNPTQPVNIYLNETWWKYKLIYFHMSIFKKSGENHISAKAFQTDGQTKISNYGVAWPLKSNSKISCRYIYVRYIQTEGNQVFFYKYDMRFSPVVTEFLASWLSTMKILNLTCRCTMKIYIRTEYRVFTAFNPESCAHFSQQWT